MIGAAIPFATSTTSSAPKGAAVDYSTVNMHRIISVADRLRLHVTGVLNEPTDFCNCCSSLAKGIDFALANNEVPPNAREFPLLVLQLCRQKSGLRRHAAIMLFILSVKNACGNGWFSQTQADEILAVVNEMQKHYGNAGDINSERSIFSVTSHIMSRFYPLLQMGEILSYRVIEPGYRACVADFYISKNLNYDRQGKIRLLVAKMDNIETPSCITSPPQVIFLLNGRGVEKRTNVPGDLGPQVPTNVTPLLKYGLNLLQVVGQFNDCYIVVVAFMSVKMTCDASSLHDYIHPETSKFNTDSDVIEGASRISLNCPLSFARISTPVKGHSCKHLQCFDFWNFMVINSRRPSWRCPLCNQHVYYSDLRLDRNIQRVLENVGENVSDVIISVDGSWKAVLASRVEDNTLPCESNKEKGLPEHLSNFSKATISFLDLTGEGDELDIPCNYETEDIKPCAASIQTCTAVSVNPAMDSLDYLNVNLTPVLTDATSLSLNQESTLDVSQMQTAFQSQLCQADYSTYRMPAISMQDQHFHFDAASRSSTIPLQSQTRSSYHTAQIPAISQQNQLSKSDYDLLQRYRHFRQSYFGNDNVRASPATGHVGIIAPMAVQALPAQAMPSTQQHSRAMLNQSNPGISSAGMQLLQSFSSNAGINFSTRPLTNQSTGMATAWEMQQLNAQYLSQRERMLVGSQHVSRQDMAGGVSRQQQAARADQCGNVPIQVSSPADLLTENSWRPTGRMRGSLSGRPIPASLNQLIIQPTPTSQSNKSVS